MTPARARMATASLLAACMLLFTGCGDDVGSPCTLKGELREDRDVLIVQFSPIHPCDSQVCVSNKGRDGYCTKECTGRGRGSCPKKFSCLEVDEISPEFRGKKFCVDDDDVPEALLTPSTGQ